MMRDEFDDFLRETARSGYHPPPPTPREAIWAGIEAARTASRETPSSTEPIADLQSAGAGRPETPDIPRSGSMPARRWWGLGLAATIALGVGGGLIAKREAQLKTTPAATATASTATATATAFRLTALEHLSRTEVLLTAFRADARAGRLDMELAHSAHDLLAQTRLLLDSPAATEPRLEALLQDLELILAQVAQYPANQSRAEFDLIDRALEENDLVTRLRMTIPAGPLLAQM